MPSVFNHVYEGVQAYATSDLFEPHSTKSGYWKVYGRTDDQIMHSTGEKVSVIILRDELDADRFVPPPDQSWSTGLVFCSLVKCLVTDKTAIQRRY